jgi:ATP-binding cassette subfamily B protein
VVLPAPVVPVREIFRFFWPFARPYRRYIFLSGVLLVLVPAVQGARLYMLKVIVDEVLVPRDISPFVWIAPTVVGLTLLYGSLSFFATYAPTWIGERFLLSLRTKFFKHLQGLGLDFFERRRLGDVMSRLTGDTAEIETFVLSGVAEALSSIVQVVIFAGALFYIDWRLALIVFLVAPGFALLVRIFSRLMKQASREKRRRAGGLSAIAEESLSNVPLVQAYGRQRDEIERFHRQALGAFAATLLAGRLRALFPPLIDIVQTLSALAVVGFGTVALRDEQLSLGSLLLFVAYLNQLYAPLRGLARLYNLIYSASAGAERVIEFFKHGPTIVDRDGARPVSDPHGLVEFDHVCFRYPDTARDALTDVSLRLEPGSVVALVGHSGAGKTTIAKLLLRFYDPTAGAIRLDGQDLRELQHRSLRDNVAVLLQETLIFDGTIRENILYGRPESTDEEILRAAEAADAHGFIMALPDGYETAVGQKGRRLSGGQRQRIAIARAMIRDAPFLLLDEPTTGLDAESGHRILAPLRRLMSNRTTLVISHNLITVRDADSIVVLENGRVIERGSHAELLERGGSYARLCRLHELQDARHPVAGFEGSTSG